MEENFLPIIGFKRKRMHWSSLPQKQSKFHRKNMLIVVSQMTKFQSLFSMLSDQIFLQQTASTVLKHLH